MCEFLSYIGEESSFLDILAFRRKNKNEIADCSLIMFILFSEQVLSVSDHPHESEVRIQIPVAKPRVIQVGRPESPNTPRAQGIQPKPFVPPPPEGVNRDMMNTLGSSHNSQGKSDPDSQVGIWNFVFFVTFSVI